MKLKAKADTLRAEEKAPHLEAGRQLDAKWKPLMERAGSLKRKLKLIVFIPFLEVKDRELRARRLRRSPRNPGREHLRNQNNSRLERAVLGSKNLSPR